MFLRSVILALFLAPAAHAACLDANTINDISNVSVEFTRADGRKGDVVQGPDGIVVDYAVDRTTAWVDSRVTSYGIYEYFWSWTPTDIPYVGGGPGGSYMYRRSGTEPVPTPGTTWSTTLRTTVSKPTGTRDGPSKTRSRVRVTYSFLAAQEVKLSGCTYTAIPVEMRGSDAKLIRRWMYFPDLGFGLETRMTDPETGQDRKLGLTAMKAAK